MTRARSPSYRLAVSAGATGCAPIVAMRISLRSDFSTRRRPAWCSGRTDFASFVFLAGFEAFADFDAFDAFDAFDGLGPTAGFPCFAAFASFWPFFSLAGFACFAGFTAFAALTCFTALAFASTAFAFFACAVAPLSS